MQNNIVIDDINILAFKQMLKNINNDENNIIIVPDKFTLNAELMFFEEKNINVNFNTRIFSLTKLASVVLQKKLMDKKIIDKTQEILILSSIIKDNLQNFKYYKNIKDLNFFVEDVFNGLSLLLSSNFKDYNKNIDDVLKDKIYDLNLILNIYTQKREQEFVDSSFKFDLFLNEIKNSELIKNSNIYFAMFSSLTSQMKKIIKEISVVAKTCSFACSFTENRINNNEIYNFYKSINKLANEKKYHSLNNYNEFINNNFFTTNNKKFSLINDEIKIYELNSVSDEVDNVVEEIRKDIFLNNLRFKDICVACSSLDSFKDLICEKFNESNFSFFMDESKKLSEFSFIKFIDILLNVISNFKLNDIINLVDSFYMDIDNKAKQNFKSFIHKYNLNILKNLDNYNILSEDEYFSDFAKIYNSVINEINIIKGRNYTSVYEFFNVLDDFLVKNNCYNKLEEKTKSYLNSDILQYKQYNQIKTKFEDVKNNLIEFYKEEFNLNKLIYFFNICVNNLTISLASSGVDSIFVGDVVNSYFKIYKKIYLIGLNNKNFPIVNVEHGLLSDEELKQIEIEEITPKISDINKLNYYKCFEILLSSTYNLVLSYSVTNFNNEKVFPSIFIKNFLNRFLINSKNLTILKRSNEEFNYLSEEKILGLLPFKLNNVHELQREFLKSENKLKYVIKKALDHKSFAINDDFDYKIDKNLLKNLSFSSSGLENYFSCGYKYFYKNVLKLKEFEESSFNAKVIGNIVHKCCYYFGQKLIKKDEISESIKENIIKKVLASKEYKFLLLNSNYKILVSNLKNEILRLFDFILAQQKLSKFKISKVEYYFNYTLNNINFVGFIDRVDETENEFILIDYKTGNTSIDYDDIILNKKIQLLLYAKILENLLNKKCAGIFYLTINDDFSTKGVKNINLNGIIVNKVNLKNIVEDESLINFDEKYILNDNQFEKLKKYTFNNIESAIQKILQGEIYEDPKIINGKSPCEYCEFNSICKAKNEIEVSVDENILKDILND